MKILELYFILFSKLYVRFSKREDDWFYLPLLIISFILISNLIIISFLFFDLSVYVAIGLIILLYILFIIYFVPIKEKGKEFVKNYNLSKKVTFLLVISLIINFSILFTILHSVREKNISSKTKENIRKIEIEEYKYE